MAEETQTDVQADVVSEVTDTDGIVSLDELTPETGAEEVESQDTADKGDETAKVEVDTETGDNEGEDADKDAETGDVKDEDAGEVEMLEFDFGGNKLEVPKDSVPPELATRIDEFAKGTWSTFTKGQQENVERATSLDAREQTVAKLNTLNGDALQTYAHGLLLRSDIEQLSQVDLGPLWQSEPDRARQVSDLLGSKQAEFQTVLAKVGENERAVQEAEQTEVSRRTEEGTLYLNKHINNFSSEKASELVDYVCQTYGMPKEQADRWAMNPIVTRMAYKAMLFDRQTGAAKRPTAKPVQALTASRRMSSGQRHSTHESRPSQS